MAKRKSSTTSKKTPAKPKVASKQRQIKTDKSPARSKAKPAASKAAKKPAAIKAPVHLSRWDKVRRALASDRAACIFKWASLGILLGTTIFWAVLSARLQASNADQLIDAYLFEHWQTFQAASFPGAHTFLIKWPLFALMALLGNTSAVFMGATVFLTLLTVGGLAYVLHKIECRPRVIGVLWLALSVVLLAIPAQPQPGALLPLNLAMITTRNIEYLVLIAAFVGIIKAGKLEHRLFWLSAAGLALAVAGDKLFLPLVLGAGIFALAVYQFFGAKIRTALPLRVLLAGVAAFLGSVIILRIISATGLTHIANEGSASPYRFVDSPKQFIEACVYAVTNMLTNFGANPISNSTVLKDMPGALIKSLGYASVLVYAGNFLIFCGGIFALCKVTKARAQDIASRLTLLLAGSSLMALAVFVLTKHYYPADARYLSIMFFALFIGLATYLRGRVLRARHTGMVAVVIVFLVPLAMAVSWRQYQADAVALDAQNSLSQNIAGELKKQSVRVLMGDYWQVTPVKNHVGKALTIVPADHCLEPVKTLSSSAWSGQLGNNPSAVLLTDTGANSCQLSRVLERYGPPSSRVVLDKDTQLLVYKRGIKKVAAMPHKHSPRIKPLRSSGLCTPGTTLNVVAHEDDDLLFLSPDVLNDVQAKKCVRTIYLTAGNAGGKADYWHSREAGAEAAYAQMLGVANVWHESSSRILGNKISWHIPNEAPNVSLVFLRLPDGNMGGEGFESTGYASLQQLLSGNLAQLNTIEGTGAFNRQGLLDTLGWFMRLDKPNIIRTQGYDNDYYDGDHSDHHAAGDFTQLAWQQYDIPAQLFRYQGYPDKSRPANVAPEDIELKTAAFLRYASHDQAVCQTALACSSSNTYGKYLSRQYKAEIYH